MRILQLTNYPTVNPLHGGQIRSYQIAKQLRISGNEVKSIAVYVDEDYKDVDQDDIPFSRSSPFWSGSIPSLSDYYTGLYAVNDQEVFHKLLSLLKNFKPHIVMVEQPWLFAVAKKFTKNTTIKLVYSSQNIEWRLKDKILDRENPAQKEYLTSEIKKLEIDAVRIANLTVACTVQDAKYYNELGGSKKSQVTVVAGNGVEEFSCKEERVGEWQKFLTLPTAVFVSSAHIPNAQGFWEMMSPGLTFLKQGEQILIIGSISGILTQVKGFNEFSDLNLSRLNLAGTREKTELQSLVRASHVVLLPITDGEGSNLKTAEALESGCFIVGTNKAFRGFEAAVSLPHITIADNPNDFRKAVRRILNTPRNTDGTPYKIRSQYYWEQQLAPLVRAIANLS
jgi:glycosyltransferase involved in cell wall biosynthesis